MHRRLNIYALFRIKPFQWIIMLHNLCTKIWTENVLKFSLHEYAVTWVNPLSNALCPPSPTRRFNLLTFLYLDQILQHGKACKQANEQLWPMKIRIFWIDFKWIDQTAKMIYFTNNFFQSHYSKITWQWNYQVK